MTEKLLIIGGQGPIGAWVAKVLLDEGADFILLDRRPDNSFLSRVIEPERLPAVQRHFGDHGDPKAVSRAAEARGATRTIRLEGAGAIVIAGAGLYGVGHEEGPGGPFTRAIKSAVLGRRFEVPPGSIDLAYAEDAARALLAAARAPEGPPAEVRPPAARIGAGEFLRELAKLVPACAGKFTVAGGSGGEEDLGLALEDVSREAPVPPTPLREGIRLTIENYRRLAREGRLRKDRDG